MQRRHAMVCAAVAPAVRWGLVVAGRRPTGAEARRYNNAVRAAIHGDMAANGRHSRDLERALLWGPRADLEALA
eukprot:15118390-Alexandrium_andersonii.AAC.1